MSGKQRGVLHVPVGLGDPLPLAWSQSRLGVTGEQVSVALPSLCHTAGDKEFAFGEQEPGFIRLCAGSVTIRAAIGVPYDKKAS